MQAAPSWTQEKPIWGSGNQRKTTCSNGKENWSGAQIEDEPALDEKDYSFDQRTKTENWAEALRRETSLEREQETGHAAARGKIQTSTGSDRRAQKTGTGVVAWTSWSTGTGTRKPKT
jgi:hypothetical protein